MRELLAGMRKSSRRLGFKEAWSKTLVRGQDLVDIFPKVFQETLQSLLPPKDIKHAIELKVSLLQA